MTTLCLLPRRLTAQQLTTAAMVAGPRMSLAMLSGGQLTYLGLGMGLGLGLGHMQPVSCVAAQLNRLYTQKAGLPAVCAAAGPHACPISLHRVAEPLCPTPAAHSLQHAYRGGVQLRLYLRVLHQLCGRVLR